MLKLDMGKFLVIWVVLLTLFTQPAFGIAKCPFGRVNDPAPGQCSLYIDENNNDLCDRSETSEQPEERGDSRSIQTGQTNLISWWAIFMPSALYFLHWFLVKIFKDKPLFSPAGLKYIWNVILLLLFIPGGIFGLLLGLGIKTPFLVYWHIQGGAAFLIIAFIHMLNHLTYYIKGWKVLGIN